MSSLGKTTIIPIGIFVTCILGLIYFTRQGNVNPTDANAEKDVNIEYQEKKEGDADFIPEYNDMDAVSSENNLELLPLNDYGEKDGGSKSSSYKRRKRSYKLKSKKSKKNRKSKKRNKNKK